MILGINSATNYSELALLSRKNEEVKILVEKKWDAFNDEAKSFLPNLELLLAETKLNKEDIKEVVCINGPGSFTGLRVGISIANTIGYLNKAKLYQVSTFEYLERKFNISDIKGKSGLLLFAGSRGVYYYTESLIEQISILDLENFLISNGIKNIYGNVSDDQKILLEKKGFNFLKNKLSFGKVLISLLESNSLESKAMIEANYVKKPKITISKKKII